MSVFQQTDEGDLYRPAGAKSFVRVGDIEQARYHMRTRLRLFRLEVIWDQRIGLAFFELISNPRTDTNMIANHIASICLGTPGVVECQLSFDFEAVRAVLTVEGEVVYSVGDQRERVPIHEKIQILSGGGSLAA